MKFKIDLSRYFPLGYEYKNEENTFYTGMLISAAVGFFGFAIRYSDALNALYWNQYGKRTIMPGAVMPDFVNVLGGTLLGFVIVMIVMLAFAAVHYSYHYRHSKSIYLMRRLPKRSELHRRCWTFPLVCAAACILAAFIFLLINFAIYMLATPDVCLTPGQWQKIWRALI